MSFILEGLEKIRDLLFFRYFNRLFVSVGNIFNVFKIIFCGELFLKNGDFFFKFSKLVVLLIVMC